MRSMAHALAQAGVSTQAQEKAPLKEKDFQAAQAHTRIDDENRVSIADTPAGMMREACAPEPRPSKKRQKMQWPTRTRVKGTRKTLVTYEVSASDTLARLQALTGKL